MSGLPADAISSCLGPDLLWRNLRISRPQRQVSALFLDRDGVLIEDSGYLCDPTRVVLLDGVANLIRVAHQLGMLVVQVTNQSGIGRGMYGWPEFVQVEQQVAALLASQGVSLDASFACPFHERAAAPYQASHHPWRKPNPGMLREAARLLAIDLHRSVLAGDRMSDILAAKNAGLPVAIHVLTGLHDRSVNAPSAAGDGFQVLECDTAVDITRHLPRIFTAVQTTPA